MPKFMLVALIVILAVYLAICILAYVFQERLIFLPDRIHAKYQFQFPGSYSEIFLKADDGIQLHGLLFTTEQSKGVILYLHGNGGALDSWGSVASTYQDFGYDVLMLDYRGYGKSEGAIESESQLVDDVQLYYNYLLKHYHENDVIALGYSLGSGLAAKMAARNNPRMLIMQAPYYSLTDMMKHSFPFLPTFLLKYKLSTNESLHECEMPIVLIHGDRDEVIPYSQSLKLKALLKPGDTLITLQGVGHNGMTDKPAYLQAIRSILSTDSW
ncbi:alpha/beta hydrolase [Chryseolinea sp. T2]|uniref:alpha/beta hydrolase n=1 Tax=Chryseolinea sp. T2 TaxID=3129255 RepID=UPI003077492B